MTESVYLIFNILSFRLDYIQGQRTKVVLSGGTLRWGKVLMGARFVGKIYVFQTAPHANCDSKYDIYHIRGLYSGLTVIHLTNRLFMIDIEIRFELKLLNYKYFWCKDLRIKISRR